MGWVNHVRRWGKLPYALVANRLATPVLVLLYHRVCELPSDPQSLAVSPERFRRQLQLIREHYPVVRFGDDWAALDHPAVCITFDDGYADNVTKALPIIEELSLHATFFITTGMVGSMQEFWWDELERLLLISRERPSRLALQHQDLSVDFDTDSPSASRQAYTALHRLLRPLPQAARERLLSQLRDWAGVTATGRETHRALSTEQLRQLGTSPHAGVGAHTVSHDVLSTLPPGEQRRQIETSVIQLSDMLEQPVTTFAYPYGGRRDFTPVSLQICRDLGLARCAANVPGIAYPWSDPVRIPRQVVGNWDLPEFSRWLRWAWTR